MIALAIIVLLSCACNSYKFHHEITFYSESNHTGNSFTLRDVKLPRNFSWLVPENFGLPKSHCYVGRWKFHEEENYSPRKMNEWYSTYGSRQKTCGNNYYNSKYYWMRHHTGSARYLGPINPRLESISFYSERSFNGIELVIERAAYANLPFSPQSMLITGRSNWTFYTGNNFDGISTCFISNSYSGDTAFNEFNSTWNSTKSVLKGCDTSGFGATFLPNEIGGQQVLF